MHELSIAQEIIRIVQDQQSQHGFDKVDTIRVHAGALSGVDSHALRFSFQVVRRGTCAAAAQLDIETEAMKLLCRRCGCTSSGEHGPTGCDKCGSQDIVFDASAEIYIISLEVD